MRFKEAEDGMWDVTGREGKEEEEIRDSVITTIPFSIVCHQVTSEMTNVTSTVFLDLDEL